MARPGRLNRPSGPLPLGLALALVLALGAHVLLLDWLAARSLDPPALKPLTEPMFTRLLQPQTPPPAPVFESKRHVAQANRASFAMKNIAPAASMPAATATAAAGEEAFGPAADAVDAPAAASAAPADPAPVDTGNAGLPGETTETTGAAAPASASVSSPDSSPAEAALPPLDSWPRDTRLNYQLGGRYRSGELYGSARVQWQRQGPLYQARVELDITLAGSRVLTSQGDVTPDGLLPRAFEETRGGKRRGVQFGDDALIFNDGRSVPKPAGVQDSASQFVELSHRFATGREKLEVGRSVDVWLARPGAVDLWTYDIVSSELLRTPRLGEVEAFRLKPRPIANPRGNITAEIWFAPTLQYLPVRIRVSMGDEAHVDLMVDTIEQR